MLRINGKQNRVYIAASSALLSWIQPTIIRVSKLAVANVLACRTARSRARSLRVKKLTKELYKMKRETVLLIGAATDRLCRSVFQRCSLVKRQSLARTCPASRKMSDTRKWATAEHTTGLYTRRHSRALQSVNHGAMAMAMHSCCPKWVLPK